MRSCRKRTTHPGALATDTPQPQPAMPSPLNGTATCPGLTLTRSRAPDRAYAQALQHISPRPASSPHELLPRALPSPVRPLRERSRLSHFIGNGAGGAERWGEAER